MRSDHTAGSDVEEETSEEAREVTRRRKVFERSKRDGRRET